MNQERLMKVLLSQLITEKTASASMDNRLYAFRVLLDATKAEIKAAIETLFSVHVKSVRVCRVAGKSKRVGRQRKKVTTQSIKKAYVTLAQGEALDIT